MYITKADQGTQNELPEISSGMKRSRNKDLNIFSSINFDSLPQGLSDGKKHQMSLSFYPRKNDSYEFINQQERAYKGPIQNFAVNHRLKQMTHRIQRFKDLKKCTIDKQLPNIQSPFTPRKFQAIGKNLTPKLSDLSFKGKNNFPKATFYNQ